MRNLRLLAAAFLLTIGVSGACSGSDPAVGGNAPSNDAQGGTAGTAGAAGSSGALGTGPGGTNGRGGSGGAGDFDAGPRDANFPDVTFNYDAQLGDGAVTPDSACVTATARASSVPLDLYVMLDRSGSMNLPQPLPANGNPGLGDCNVGSNTVSRWCYAINALGSFFRAPSSAGIGAALQFFPNGTCNSNVPYGYGCCSSGSCCNGQPDSAAAVGLAALPGNANNLIAALDAQIPWGDRTPLEAALYGLMRYTKNHRSPGREIVGLLITDGGPEGCESRPEKLASIARSSLETNGVRTFVMGVEGAVFSTLETIAIAGGAPAHTANCEAGISPCHFYSVRDGTAAAFNNALAAIRRASIGCEFTMPTTDAGVIDPDRVSIQYFPAGGSFAQHIAKVKDAAACGGDGFYYDDDRSPSSLTLCPSTCSRVQGDNRARLDILLGCLGS